MDRPDFDSRDRRMMERCIALSGQSGQEGEYPYAAIVCRGDRIVAESTNRVKQDSDVTRHAEVVTISLAQKILGTVSLDDCTLYSNAEPCAFCSYAIRESRIGRVVYGLTSPHMGGVSRWRILPDEELSRLMPEVFAPPPEIVAGFMAEEAEQTLRKWSPLATFVLEQRGLLSVQPQDRRARRRGGGEWLMAPLRRLFFDRFGRR